MEKTATKDRKQKAEPAGQPRLGELDDYIGFHLRLAQNASFKAFKRHTGDSHLRPGWFAVMMIIHHNPGITPMALSRASGRDKSTITPVLRDLLHEGLIARRPIPADRRSYALHLTEEGIERLRHLADCAAEHDRELDEIVGAGKPELIRLLKRIAAFLD